MSKNNIVVPDHFKVAGREPQGQDIAHEVQKQNYASMRAAEKRARKGTKAEQTKIKGGNAIKKNNH